MKMMTMGFAAVLAAGCGGGAILGDGTTARAELLDAEGRSVGTVMLEQNGATTELMVHANDLPPGVHGIHIHETGRCAPPEFTSAGGHFNPHGRDHGFDNPEGYHAGDLQNIQVGSNGEGNFQLDAGVPLVGDDDAILDADGAAVVVHAGADDYRTDPAGDSGARIACGIIVR
jgi:Cu-Zn family superoxide dismutase